MKKQEALTLLGLLFNKSYQVFTRDVKYFHEADKELVDKVYNYLESLDISFNIAYDVLDEVYFRFYHNKWFSKSDELESKNTKDLMYSEFDYIEIDENGRVGIWCEVDGFIAWLDEYNISWIVKSKRKVLKEEKNSHKKFKKAMKEWSKAIRWSGCSHDDCDAFVIPLSDIYDDEHYLVEEIDDE